MATAVTLDDEPLSTLKDPLPLPPYEFDESLSEDENFLTWVSILARHSSSRKGHMGTIFVRPPEEGDPSDEAKGSSSCRPAARQRIIHYGNNTPLLYSRLQKAVPEVHAEALVISRCARRGIALEGCTVYISFPPCNDCFRLLLSAGIRRCVYKKSIFNKDAQGEGALVAAHVYGLELSGTLDRVVDCQAVGDTAGMAREREEEKRLDELRDQRVRRFWASVGEDANRTRARVSRWWEWYTSKYRAAEKDIRKRYGNSGVEQAEKRRESEREARKAARREAQEQKEKNNKEKKDEQAALNGLRTSTSVSEDMLDELMNQSGKRASLEDEEDGVSAATKVQRMDD